MRRLPLLFGGLLLLVAMAPAAMAGTDIRATVLSIGDGDTIRVLAQGRKITIRLACIDAPEMAQAPYGAQSRAYLQTRLRIGSPVTLLPQTVDRYGRTVAEVIGEVNLNLAMVEDGMAYPLRGPAATANLGQCDAREYLELRSGPRAAALASGRYQGGSPGPGTFAAAERLDLGAHPDRFLVAGETLLLRSRALRS